jgi:hypothetical protein
MTGGVFGTPSRLQLHCPQAFADTSGVGGASVRWPGFVITSVVAFSASLSYAFLVTRNLLRGTFTVPSLPQPQRCTSGNVKEVLGSVLLSVNVTLPSAWYVSFNK